MAKWNSGTQTVGLEKSQMEYDATGFDADHQGYAVECSATDSTGVEHKNIACIFKVAPVTSVEEIASVRDSLKVTGLAADIDSGTVFTVRTSENRFRNPPSTTAITTYEASSHSNGGSTIDS